MTAYINCPKCGSAGILKFNNRSGPKGPNYLYVFAPHVKICSIPLYAETLSIPIYICVDCGYIQNYIDNTEDLELVKALWGKEI